MTDKIDHFTFIYCSFVNDFSDKDQKHYDIVNKDRNFKPIFFWYQTM